MSLVVYGIIYLLAMCELDYKFQEDQIYSLMRTSTLYINSAKCEFLLTCWSNLAAE